MRFYFIIGITSIGTILSLPSKSAINTHVNNYVERLEIPSMAISVTSSNNVIFQKAFGYSDVENKILANTKTIYPAGSISKSITAALIALYCEKGFLGINDKIKDYIPFFELYNPYNTYQVTIKDYLTHRSGYTLHDALWINTRISRKKLIEKLKFIPEKYELRDRFSYQNIGYSIAAFALENLLGKSYQQLVQEDIFDKINMKTATFDIEKMKSSKNFAYGYCSGKNGFEKVPFIDAYSIAPSGGLCCNIEDLTKWTQMLQNKGSGVFSEHTYQTLTSPHILSDVLTDPKLGLNEYITSEAYGLGFFIIQYRGKKVIFHGGNIEGHSALVMYSPKDDLGISILTNKDRSVAPYLIAISLIDKLTELSELDWEEKYRQLIDLEQNSFVLERKDQSSFNNSSASPTLDLENYIGKFSHKGYGRCSVVEEGGKLFLSYNNYKIELEHLHYSTFITTKDCPHFIWKNMKFHFRQSYNGDISSVATMFNSLDGPIVFKKNRNAFFHTSRYLQKFCGKYMYGGFTFTIEEGVNCITLKAFGQPPYHLIGEKDLLFSIFSEDDGYKDYRVLFEVDDNDNVLSVKLVKPDGVSYKAKRINL